MNIIHIMQHPFNVIATVETLIVFEPWSYHLWRVLFEDDNA